MCETVAEIHSYIAFEEFVVAMCLGVSARVCRWAAVRLCILTPQSESRPRMSRVCWRRRSPSSYCAVPSGPSAPQARWTARGSCSWSCPRSSGPLGLTCPWWRRKERKTDVLDAAWCKCGLWCKSSRRGEWISYNALQQECLSPGLEGRI